MNTNQTLSLTVNGVEYTREVPARMNLVDFLRNELHLTGSHVGCEHGVCGACTVLVDGLSVRGCLMFALQAQDCHITTIEGLADKDGALSPLQAAFHDQHGLQCGFCTPGMLMTLQELLNEGITPTEDELRERLSGNLCRCTGYEGIVKAALQVLQSQSNAESSP